MFSPSLHSTLCDYLGVIELFGSVTPMNLTLLRQPASFFFHHRVPMVSRYPNRLPSSLQYENRRSNTPSMRDRLAFTIVVVATHYSSAIAHAQSRQQFG